MIEPLFRQLQSFAASDSAVSAAIIVGSHATGKAGPDSDVDIVLITSDTAKFLDDHTWLEQFGKIISLQREDYGLVQSLRVFYENGPEVEFGITSMDWLADSDRMSTIEILEIGYRVIYDPANLIRNFCDRI